MQNIDKNDSILIFEVPHQGAPNAYSFPNRAAFEDSLRETVANDGGCFTQWLYDNFEVPQGDDDGLSAIEALENDIENVIEFWNHDFHSTYVFDDRAQAQTMLDRLQPTSGPQRCHGSIGIESAIREWLRGGEA